MDFMKRCPIQTDTAELQEAITHDTTSTERTQRGCTANILACRACLEVDTKLYNLDELQLAETFYELTGTSLQVEDLPQFLCSVCCRLLQRCSEFRLRCRTVHTLLVDACARSYMITPEYIRSLDTQHLKLNFTKTTIHHTDIKPKRHRKSVQKSKKIKKELDNDLTEDELDNLPLDKIKDANIRIKREENSKFVNEYVLCTSSQEDTSIREIEDSITDKATDNIPLGAMKVEIQREVITVTKNLDNVIQHEKGIVKNVTKKRFTKNKVTKKVERKTLKQSKGECVVDTKRDREKRTKDWKEDRRCTFSNEENLANFSVTYNVQIDFLTKEQQVAEVLARKESNNYKKSVYKCDSCFKGYTNKVAFEKHMAIHDPCSGPHCCDICRIYFASPRALRRHLATHKHNFVCRQCDHSSKTAEQAKQHHNWHNGHKFVCPHCGKEFDKLTTQLSHVRLKHASARCDICGEAFIGAQGLLFHMNRSHKQALQSRCAACKLQFHSMDALNKHLDALPDRVCDPSLRACAECGDSFATGDELAAHRHERHKKVYKCDECNRTFEKERECYKHVHRPCRNGPRRGAGAGAGEGEGHGEGGRGKLVHVCEVCGARFEGNAGALRYHLRVHSGEKPHACRLCPKRFRMPVLLQYHMNTHTGAKPYKCPRCPKAFRTPMARHIHRLVHTKEMLYPCPLCGKRCRSNTYVRIHIKTAHLKEAWPRRDRRKRGEAATADN